MQSLSLSFTAPESASSSKIAVSSTAAQSAQFIGSATGSVLVISPTVDTYIRWGSNPTAVNDGTDMKLFGNNSYRVQIGGTGKMSFICDSGVSGYVFITPGV